MFKSLQICGTSGSGKTTIARQLLEEANCKRFAYDHEIEGIKKRKVYWYEGVFRDTPVAILGNYETTCGGCDTIHSVQIVAEMLQMMNHDRGTEHKVCVLEGLMISHMVGTVGETQLLMGEDYHWRAYLDTSLFTCLSNVIKRRHEAGNMKPFNPANTTADHPRVINSRSLWTFKGGIDRTIRYDHTWEDFVTIFQEVASV